MMHIIGIIVGVVILAILVEIVLLLIKREF